MSEQIELNLTGDPGEIGAEALRDTLNDTINLLAATAKALEVATPRWKVRGLKVASVHATLLSPEDLGLGSLLWHGLEELRQAAKLPNGWTQEMLKYVRNLGRRAGLDGAQTVSLSDSTASERHDIDAVITDHATRALDVEDVSWGLVVGKIQRWNGAKRTLGITLEGSPSVVEVAYPRAIEAAVREALGRDEHIAIRGQVHRNASGQVVSGRAVQLEPHAPTESVPVAQIAGIFADDPDWPSTVREWIEEHRAD